MILALRCSGHCPSRRPYTHLIFFFFTLPSSFCFVHSTSNSGLSLDNDPITNGDPARHLRYYCKGCHEIEGNGYRLEFFANPRMQGIFDQDIFSHK
ncbi:hypothetical protein LI328DRAFT_42326 [Trichoderma asperelloides]|nr:hypothetical protein LI328DRAFT_42326 [Trichoderma asperelloides]